METFATVILDWGICVPIIVNPIGSRVLINVGRVSVKGDSILFIQFLANDFFNIVRQSLSKIIEEMLLI